MNFQPLAISDIIQMTPKLIGDDRGVFCETYSRKTWLDHGIEATFVQDNHSVSLSKGTVRGLHFQAPPHAQGKLVRVVKGSIFDVAVDLRHGSPTYGRYVSALLSAENWSQLWIPVGFAHGFCTLEDKTEVVYKVTDYYAPEVDCGVRWDDPALAIAWPVGDGDATISAKDRRHPRLHELPAYFSYPS